jgi:hypothetical protein
MGTLSGPYVFISKNSKVFAEPTIQAELGESN